MWGRAAAVRPVGGSHKLTIDPDGFDENLVKHLNYFKSARLPDQAREFFGAPTALDDFWLAVRKKAVQCKRPQCGSSAQQTHTPPPALPTGL
jgi:hypothetical protein